MKKTLIIHPKDPSTTFLDVVYNSIENKTVINGGISRYELRELIKSHDQIMMMGHGSPYGLFSVDQFPGTMGYIIDHTMCDLLKLKIDNVFIWCNADRFVNNHKLKGFYSGMFISEIGEATYCGVMDMTQELVDQSNFGFCEILSKHITESPDVIYENVRTEYGLLAENNPIARYNNSRLFKR